MKTAQVSQLLHLKYSDAFRRLRPASSASASDPWWLRCLDVWVTAARRCPYLLKNLGPASMSVDRTASSGFFGQDSPGLVVFGMKRMLMIFFYWTEHTQRKQEGGGERKISCSFTKLYKSTYKSQHLKQKLLIQTKSVITFPNKRKQRK